MASPAERRGEPAGESGADIWLRLKFPLEIAVAVLAAAMILFFLAASLGRLHYSFPLEQLEGSMMLTALRVAHGLPVYIRPNFTFIPYMYAPAYFYVSGWAMKLLGQGFVPLRIVSIVSTFASFALIYLFVFLESAQAGRRQRHLMSLAAAGLYAAAYPVTNFWFDLGRVDSLYIFLILVALLCTRRFHPSIAAVAWTLAFLAKQTIAPVALIMLCYDWKRPRRVLMGTGGFFLLTLASTSWMDRATHGWFRFYAITVPHANTDLAWHPALFFVPSEVLAPFGIALAIIAAAVFFTRPRWQSTITHFYLLTGGSLFALCWFLQAHLGATQNTPMPLYAIVAVLTGISACRLYRGGEGRYGEGAASILLLLALGTQLAMHLYSPKFAVPDQALGASHREFVSWLRTFPGDVLVPSHPAQAVMAGKPWHPDVAAIHDALRPNGPNDQAARRQLLAEIHEAIDQQHFDAIALDGLPAQAQAVQYWLPADWQRAYPIVGLVPGNIGDRFANSANIFLLPCREQGLAREHGWTLLTIPGRTACP